MFENFLINLFLYWILFNFIGSLNLDLNQNSNIYISTHLITNQCLIQNQSEIIYFICNTNKIYINSCTKVIVDCHDFVLTKYNITLDKKFYISEKNYNNSYFSYVNKNETYVNKNETYYSNEYNNIYNFEKNHTIFYI